MEKETKHTPEWYFDKDGFTEILTERLGEGVEYNLARIKFNGSEDYVKSRRELIASAPTLKAENRKLENNIGVQAQIVNNLSNELTKLETELSEMKKEREEWKAALIEAKWFVDHVMGKEKRVNWGNSFGINWGRVNTALIAIDKVKI